MGLNGVPEEEASSTAATVVFADAAGPVDIPMRISLGVGTEASMSISFGILTAVSPFVVLGFESTALTDDVNSIASSKTSSSDPFFGSTTQFGSKGADKVTDMVARIIAAYENVQSNGELFMKTE